MGQLVGRLAALPIVGGDVLDQRLRLDPPVLADGPVIDHTCLEQTDQERAADIHQVGRLLCCELGVGRDDRDPLPGSHVVEHSGEQLDG